MPSRLRRTSSATDPMNARLIPWRPCVAIRTMATLRAFAAATMASPGAPETMAALDVRHARGLQHALGVRDVLARGDLLRLDRVFCDRHAGAAAELDAARGRDPRQQPSEVVDHSEDEHRAARFNDVGDVGEDGVGGLRTVGGDQG